MEFWICKTTKQVAHVIACDNKNQITEGNGKSSKRFEIEVLRFVVDYKNNLP